MPRPTLSASISRLTKRLGAPCEQDRLRALFDLYGNERFLAQLNARAAWILGRFAGERIAVQSAELCSGTFIRLDTKLRRSPIAPCHLASDSAWQRYLDKAMLNLVRSSRRAERRRRRREREHAICSVALDGRRCGRAMRGRAAHFPEAQTEIADDIATLERWSQQQDAMGRPGRNVSMLRSIEGAIARGSSSLREIARFAGTNHTEVRRFLDRARHELSQADAEPAPPRIPKSVPRGCRRSVTDPL